MFGIFRSQSFSDAHLGELHRKAGNWRGTLDLSGIKTPLILPGTRSAPDPQALDMAHMVVFCHREGIMSDGEAQKCVVPQELNSIFHALFGNLQISDLNVILVPIRSFNKRK